MLAIASYFMLRHLFVCVIKMAGATVSCALRFVVYVDCMNMSGRGALWQNYRANTVGH